MQREQGSNVISQFQFSIQQFLLSTLPTYFSASYSQPLHTVPYIHSPLTFQSLSVSYDRPLASSLQTSLTISIAMNLTMWLPTLPSPPCIAPKKLQTLSLPVSPIILCPFQLLLLCISNVHSTIHCLKCHGWRTMAYSLEKASHDTVNT